MWRGYAHVDTRGMKMVTFYSSHAYPVRSACAIARLREYDTIFSLFIAFNVILLEGLLQMRDVIYFYVCNECTLFRALKTRSFLLFMLPQKIALKIWKNSFMSLLQCFSCTKKTLNHITLLMHIFYERLFFFLETTTEAIITIIIMMEIKYLFKIHNVAIHACTSALRWSVSQ